MKIFLRLVELGVERLQEHGTTDDQVHTQTSYCGHSRAVLFHNPDWYLILKWLIIKIIGNSK